jgi:O-antigen/teichoic acid export membrane protein
MTIYVFVSFVLVIFGLILYLNIDEIFRKSLTLNQIKDAKIMYLILVFNLAIMLPGGSFTAICNAYESFVFPRIVAIIKYILRALTVVCVLSFGGKAVSMVIVDTAFNIIVVLVMGFYVLSHLKVKYNFAERNRNTFIQILSYSIWIFLLAVISQYVFNAGQFILGIATRTEVVAIFAVGIMLGGFYGAFSTAISSVFLPRATQMTINNSSEEILEMMIKIGRISFMLLMFILTGFFSLGKEFIHLWLGDDYSKSWMIAVIMMVVYTVPLIQNFANSLIEVNNKVAVKVKVYLICFSSGLISGYFLISYFQEVGMMIGISIGWSLAQICMNYYFHKHMNLNILVFFNKVLNKLLLPITILCLAITLTNHMAMHGWWSLIIKIGLYSIVYWSTLYLISMNEYEKQLIKNIIRWK